MSSTTQNDVSSAGKAWSCGSGRSSHRERSHRWSGTNIAVMVIGFIIFWPIGLALLAWIMSGRDVRDLPAAIKMLWNQYSGGIGIGREQRFMAGSENIVFNEYQQTQYDRISEIKNEIRERSRRFRDFSMQAKRRADQEEFEQFMANAPDSNS